jgi:nitrogen fixation/metabolism regulation signal transduction histidine kinase
MRFQYKLLITFALFFSAAIAATLYFFNQSQQQLLDKIDKDLDKVLRSVQFSTQLLAGDKSPDIQMLTSLIKDAAKNSSVKEISIVNKDQKVVASSNPKNIGAKRALTGKEMIIREEFGDQLDDPQRHNRYVINVPIIRDGKPIGLVQTSIVLHDFSYFMREYSIKALYAALAALLGIFIISSIVLLQLSRPLRMLTDAARSVAGGDLSANLPSGGSRDEIGQLTDAFGIMVKKLAEQKKIEEKLSALQRRAILSETAAIVSHEIRNPLNLINLTADHLLHTMKTTSQDTGEFEPIVVNFKAQIRQLNRMVEEFLAIGKPAKLTRVIFRLNELLDQIEVLIKQQLVDKKIELNKQFPASIVLYGDREQLQLVFLNIIINAIAMVPECGKITISTTEENQSVTVRIIDNGPGISSEDTEKIFEPYFSKRPGGTGLGLTLAQRIIEQHGGRITAEPKGKADGGCFEIRLPKET